MTERRLIGVRDPLANVERLLAPRFRRTLALAALLAAALAPVASLPAEAPRTGVRVSPHPAAGCDAQSMRADPGLFAATDAACVAPERESDQAYLVETARPGSTMLRQGPALSVVRLHPMFVRRLAEAIREARTAGLASAGIFSAYRPPAFGVGGFSDKFNSLHTYGLAVDMRGIGGPGSSEAKLWHDIAARHGIVCPYGAGSRREWNHCQPTGVKAIMAGDPLRGTVSPRAPIDLEAMFAMGDALVDGTDAGAGSTETGHDQADRSHERDRRLNSVAGSAANPSLHETHGQPKRRVIAEGPSVKSDPVKKYRTSSLVKENALSKRVEAENARLDRLIKGICRGC